MTDAAPSNYGDRYHFVYAAKLMLGLLPPNSKLSLIEMENISVTDKKLVDDPNYLLGVDLSAYYEGNSFNTASSIELTQVKASPLHPNNTWTLARLVRDKQSSTGNELSGTSVLRKLANMFDLAYSKIGSECCEKVCIKLVTNQALQATLATQLASIQNDLHAQGELSDTLSGRHIRNLAKEGNTLLVEIQEKTNLAWKRLSVFLRCWDLSAFGQSMLLRQETEFAQLLDEYVDMGIHFGNLINFVEEHAISNRRTDITKEQVFGMLRLRETSFFPAPASFDGIDQLQVTENLERLQQLIAQTQHSVLLVHGVSGTGKSSTLQLLQHHNIEDKAVVIYDCFGNGQGVGLDTRRFPFKNFYVQIINELALRFNTNLFVTTQIDSDSIRQRFSLAIAKAAKAASAEGKELIIAVDAIDDAAEAALEQPNLQDGSFVPTLWLVRWPENCKLIVTARTENRHLINISCDYSEIELGGFSPKETDLFLQANGQITDKEIIQFSHQRTQGNPRVLSKILSAIAHEQPNDLRTFIDQHAEATTFEYYRKQVPKALLENQNDWLLLAILREATQFITVEELSTMSSQSQRNIRSLVGRLYFGLHITDENEITWPDKDFISYVRSFSVDYIEYAQKLLAEYCLQHFESSEYAQRHLSRHLFRAGKRKELISWWMSDDRLIKKLIKSQPHTEDVAGDIQYALLSAIEEKEFEIALKVLALAAEIAQGLDVFSTIATDFPRVIAEQGYTGRLLGHLRQRKSDSDLMPTLFSLARALAEYTGQHEIARQLYEEGLDAAERIKRRFKRDTIWANKTILDIAVYKAYTDGLASGLDSLTRWKPEDSVAKFYTDLTYLWCQEHDAQDALEIIQSLTLSDRQKAYAYLGALKNGNLASPTIQMLAGEVLSALNSKELDKFGRNPTYDRDTPQHLAMVLDSLVRHDVKDTASEILAYWHVNAPTSRHHVEIDYVQRIAYRHYLGIEPFNPDLFEIPGKKPEETKEASSASEYKNSERKREVSEIRTMLKLLYPPRLIRLRALSGEAPEVILQEINAYIDEWWGQSKPYWYSPFFSSHVQSSCAQLIEAVCYLPNYYETTIQKIIELSERLTRIQGGYSLKAYINILSVHTKYLAEAERLTHQQLERITVPNYSASEAVTALLELYPAALQLDRNLALNIFMKARIEAGGWDNRLDGAAYALLATLQHSQPVSDMTVDQLNQLVAVFQVIEKVTDGFEVEIHLDWFVRLLTNINPHYSLAALFDFDQSGFIPLQDSVEGVAHSLLDQDIPSESIYPLSHMMDTVKKGTSIYQRAILSAQGKTRDGILNAYSRYVQVETERHNRVYYAKELVDWAKENNLFQHQAVSDIDALATQLEAFESIKTRSKVDETNYDRKGQKIFSKFKNETEKSPQLGLQVLLDASNDDLRNMQFTLLSKAIQQLSQQLPSNRINDILQIVERFNEQSYEPKAFSLLTIVAENSFSSQTVSDACLQSLGRMLKPAQIDLLTRWWYREHLDTLLSCDALDKHDMLQVFLRAASKSLSSLHANELYRLVGGLSRMLEPQQSFSLYETLHTRAVSKLPADYSCSVIPYSSGDLYAQYIKFLADSLGHPDQRLCWSVLYTLVDICIKRPNPSIALLIDELDDKSHARWMTKRVWLLILFQHLALKEPSELIPFIQDFADIALDKVFPHAKMRYHAKEIIISLASLSPELVGNDVMESIAKVNQPHSTLEKEDHSPKHRRDEDNDESWTFDWDTTRYWYSGLEDCFGGDRPSVALAARNWILNVMGISAEQAHYKNDWVSKEYDYDDTSHAQGGFPRVETLRLYAELHAMYLVAGEFVDKYPAYLESWSNETRWEDYERYRVRGLDPVLPIKLAQPLPTTAANYGNFSTSYTDWAKKDNEQEFLAELWKDGQKKELVVAANFGSSSDERDWDVIIDSYFVNPEVSASLARLINSQADFVALPYSHYSPYNYSLSDLAEKPQKWNDDDSFFEGEYNIGIFKLFGWTIHWSQELPQHNLDSRQERYGISLEMLAPPFFVQNNIQLNPLTLEWHQKGEKKIGYSEFWSDREGRGRYENFISGRRLIIHSDFIQDYLEKNELELLVTVRLKRNRPYTDQYREEREYDHGTIRAFVINANCEAKLYMKENLIKKGHELIDEFSNERESTLHRWMAHHLAHLMQVIESAETNEERQVASEKYADLISKLWAVQTEEKTIKLQQKLWNVIRVPSDELDLAALSDALNNPPKNEDLSPEIWNKLFQLVTEVERWLWRVSTLSVTVDGAAEEFSLDEFLQRESIPDLITKLAQVFPELADLDITDKSVTHNRVSEAMRKLYILRQSLVWKSDVSEK